METRLETEAAGVMRRIEYAVRSRCRIYQSTITECDRQDISQDAALGFVSRCQSIDQTDDSQWYGAIRCAVRDAFRTYFEQRIGNRERTTKTGLKEVWREPARSKERTAWRWMTRADRAQSQDAVIALN